MKRKWIVFVLLMVVILAVPMQALAEDVFYVPLYKGGNIVFFTKPVLNWITCQAWRVRFADEFPGGGGSYSAYVVLDGFDTDNGVWVFSDSKIIPLNSPAIPESLYWPTLEYKASGGYRILFVSSVVWYRTLDPLKACRVHLPIVFKSSYLAAPPPPGGAKVTFPDNLSTGDGALAPKNPYP